MTARIGLLIALLGAAAPAWAQDTGTPMQPEPEPAPATEPAPTAEPTPTGDEATEPSPTGDEATEPAAEAAPAPRAKHGAGTRTRPGILAGLELGPAFALSPLKTSFLPRLELGVELPFVERRLRPFFVVGWSRPGAQGSGTDARVPNGSWSWDLKQNEWTLGVGVYGALLKPGSAPVIPEVGIGAEAWLLTSRINGSAGGNAFPESTEVYSKGGLFLVAGVRVPLGPGELTGRLTWHNAKLDGVVTGISHTMQLAPTVGYQFVF